MKISELIKELKSFKDKHGDLTVYITKEFVADTEVDKISHTRAYQCLLGNSYIDNYSCTTKQLIEEIKKDMMDYAKEYLDCTHCKFYNDDTKKCIDFYKYDKMRKDYDGGERSVREISIPIKETKNCIWDNSNVLTCFEPKNHVEDEKIYRMKHYLRILENKSKVKMNE